MKTYMRNPIGRVSLPAAFALGLTALTAWGQAGARPPHIGYLYPAGAQRAETVTVMVGGQFLRNLVGVDVTGTGVRAEVDRYVGPFRLDGDQRKELGRRLKTLLVERCRETDEWQTVKDIIPRDWLRTMKGVPAKTEHGDPIELPDHPLIKGLEKMSLRKLLHVRNELLSYRDKKQQNAQINELAVIKITVDKGAPTGSREVRLGTRLGISNPMAFQVGDIPEKMEQEPNDPRGGKRAGSPESILPELPAVRVPAVLNGQIMPGDVDRFRFAARKGQRLVIEARARQLLPYLADAVPGWFQAVMTVYDESGREVAYTDDYRFLPDPVMLFEVPRDGEYVLEIRDSIYRGREDFVYRITLSERPFITGIYPLGARKGSNASVTLSGWNLPNREAKLDTSAGARDRMLTVQGKHGRSNPVFYEVGTLAEYAEQAPPGNTEKPQRIELPATVNGRIGRAGDVDVFSFKGKAGDRIVAAIRARELYSPLDSLLRITDAGGAVIGWNDDLIEKDGHLHTGHGLLTHQADSYVSVELPRDGTYSVQVSDTRRHGGKDYAYRLRIGPPQPDFQLRVTPPSLTARAGLAIPITVYARRKDGFAGPIDVSLKNAPEGVALHGGRIPAGVDHIRMTVAAPAQTEGPVALRFEGSAEIDGQTVRHAASPAENRMQAFLWRHLAPADETLLYVLGHRRARRPVQSPGDGVVTRIPIGGSARVRLRVPFHPRLKQIDWELSEPPEGVALLKAELSKPGLLSLDLAALDTAKAVTDNLIVEARFRGKDKNGKPRRPVTVGVLPALPIVVEP